MQKVPAICEVQFIRSADTAHAHLVTIALVRVLSFTSHQNSASELQIRECGQHDTYASARGRLKGVESYEVLQQNICSYGTRRPVDWYTTLKMEAASFSKSYTPIYTV